MDKYALKIFYQHPRLRHNMHTKSTDTWTLAWDNNGPIIHFNNNTVTKRSAEYASPTSWSTRVHCTIGIAVWIISSPCPQERRNSPSCETFDSLNRQTISNRYAIPRAEELFNSLQGASVSSHLQLFYRCHEQHLPTIPSRLGFRIP